MDRCVRCGAELGVGRFCLNCGHRIGEPVPPSPVDPVDPVPLVADPAPAPVEPMSLPVQAADPTAVPPVTAPPAAPEIDPDVPEDADHQGEPRPEHETASVAAAEDPAEWDPEEDLLPYEEVDDLDQDAPLRGRAWLAWVLGAALLVGLVLVLLRVLGADDEDAVSSAPDASESSAPVPDQGSGSGSEGSEEAPAASTDGPKGVGKRIDLATAATITVPATAPPTTDLDGNLVAYEAGQMQDGDPRTTWRMAGDASGQTVTITLAEPAVVYRVGMVNGYAKQVAGVDWYPNNRRILTVTWGFEDGTTIEQTFAEQPGLQRLAVPPVQTGTVTLVISSVTPPGSGNLGRDYTAISEVSIIGRRAG